MTDNLTSFRQAMEVDGLTPGDIIPGRLQRFPGIGKKNGNTAGWCRLFDDCRGGVYGDYSTDLSKTWQAEQSETYSPEQKAAFRAQVAESRRQAEQAEKERQAKAVSVAAEILQGATGNPGQHPYYLKKGLPLGDHARRGSWPQRGWNDALLFPIFSSDGTIASLQAINADGNKDFLIGGKIKACFYPLGKISGATGLVVIGEGITTVAAVCHVMQCPGAAAMSAGNLGAVAVEVRKLAPGTKIIIVADDDQKPDGSNPGRDAAQKAAAATGCCSWAIPVMGRKADAWDVWHEQGGEGIKAMMAAARVTSGGWSDPLPLTTHQHAAPYPLNALPGIIGAAVREVVTFVQCPVALGACSALAVISTVGQGLIDVRRSNKLEGPASLFLVAVADSGERKTTADSFFTKPVRRWEAEQMEAAKPDLERFTAELAVWESRKSGLLAAVATASKSGKPTDDLERQVVELESNKPQRPKIPQLLFGDSTPEETAYRLAHKWPVGGILSSEAGIVLGGHAMGKESAMRNMGLLNGTWDAEPLRIDRRSGPSYTVRGVRLTIGLAVQSETVKAFFDSSKGLARGIGFLARFLIAWPESTQGSRMFQDPPEHWPQLAKFHRRLSVLLERPLTFNESGELTPVMLELSQAAKKVWISFHDDVEAELRPGRDMAETKDVASKAADNAARLAALFHLFENGTEGMIEENHMEAAAVVAGWHLYEARRFMGEITLDVVKSHAAKLDSWLVAFCKRNKVAEVSPRDIQREGPNCTRSRVILDAALAELIESGRVRVAEDKQRKKVEINPALLEG
jgi:putative DNA primase/helicase